MAAVTAPTDPTPRGHRQGRYPHRLGSDDTLEGFAGADFLNGGWTGEFSVTAPSTTARTPA